MAIICECPVGASLGDITIDDCPQDLGQVQKIAFQRQYETGTTKNSIADPTILASWTPLLSAIDGTKVVSTPYLNAPETEVGAPRTYGGGNETLGGNEIIIGREATAFTAKLLSQPQKTIEEMKAYMCEVVGVWLFDENGNIGCLVDDVDTPTAYYPIPLVARSLFVGDKMLGGYENPDENGIQWRFPQNWSDKFVIVKPTDFNPLTDL